MWRRLEKWQNNIEVGIDKDKYLTMCEQMGVEPSETKCPPDIADLPLPIQQALDVFNRLGDRVYPDIGYMGKDFTSLAIHMEVVGVTEKDIFMEALVRLDASMIKRSAEQMKKARESMKKKGNG